MQIKNVNAYQIAQRVMADLKGAVCEMIASAPDTGLTNAEIGRALGIYSGHIGHEGHISRTLLAIMEAEGVVHQDKATKRWALGNAQEQADIGAPVMRG